MLVLKLAFIVVNGLFVLRYTPPTYRYLRDEFGGRFPFDYPTWYYRLRLRRRKKGVRHE